MFLTCEYDVCLLLPCPHFGVLLLEAAHVEVHPLRVCRCQVQLLRSGSVGARGDAGDVERGGAPVAVYVNERCVMIKSRLS